MRTAGLDLSSAEAIAQGGQSGALLVKGDPASSLLMKVVGYSDRIKMPPAGKLPDTVISDLEAWIRAGAPIPAALVSDVRPRNAGANFGEQERRFWAFQKIGAVTPPPVKDESWIRTPVDRFILARLEARGLKPSPPADRATLLRRVTVDLTGLPPTEARWVAKGDPISQREFIHTIFGIPA